MFDFLIWDNVFGKLLIIIAQIFAIIIPLFISVAFLIYSERKVLGAIQLRRGPNVVGPYGLFQIPADGLKFIFKEIYSKREVSRYL